VATRHTEVMRWSPLLVLLVGCYLAHEPEPAFDEPRCCQSGRFLVEGGRRDGTRIDIDACPVERCLVDGVETECLLGHGSLLMELDPASLFQVPIFECLGPETEAWVGRESVTLRRF